MQIPCFDFSLCRDLFFTLVLLFIPGSNSIFPIVVGVDGGLSVGVADSLGVCGSLRVGGGLSVGVGGGLSGGVGGGLSMGVGGGLGAGVGVGGGIGLFRVSSNTSSSILSPIGMGMESFGLNFCFFVIVSLSLEIFGTFSCIYPGSHCLKNKIIVFPTLGTI